MWIYTCLGTHYCDIIKMSRATMSILGRDPFIRSTKNTTSSYRSELVGVYGGLRFVKKLCNAEKLLPAH